MDRFIQANNVFRGSKQSVPRHETHCLEPLNTLFQAYETNIHLLLNDFLNSQ